ncbi:MAG TPA: hypothetical protein VHB48_13850 [Chitinophagaceae bacterium]|nr:hypothetical protein [Chitinophagaceae bacterium]
MTEIFVENSRVDVTADISALLTFALDDVKDFSSRQTTFSKTIVLPGTANNNRLFGHVFQFGSANNYNSSLPNSGYNFNAAKSASVIIFQNNLQTFQGSLRLLTIHIDNGRIEYEVAMFGNLAQLNVALAPSSTNNPDGTTTNNKGYLENLDFSAHNHNYTVSNITASWGNTGSGYYYPLIDYGNYSTAAIQTANPGFTQKHDWCIGTFRPALFVKEYIDKMFAAAGFTYDCALFNSDRFKRLIIPHNQKILSSNITTLVDFGRGTTYTPISYTNGHSSASLQWDVNNTLRNFTATSGSDGQYRFQYAGADPITLDLQFRIDFGWRLASTGNTITIELYKNGSALSTRVYKTVTTTGGILITSGSWQAEALVSFVTGDYFDFNVSVNNASDTQYLFEFIGPYSYITGKTKTAVNSALGYGDPVIVNDTIPRNIKQIDFLVSIVKLFNLYVYEDKFNPKKIFIQPFADNADPADYVPGFYTPGSSNSVDWTYKLNRSKPITVKPMSELTANVYNFKMATDSDYYNDLYQKRYNQNYGDYIFNSQYEFSTGSQDCQVIFAGTPLVGYGSDEEKVYSTIFKRSGSDDNPTEEQTDCVIRILQSREITGLAHAWSIYNADASAVLSGGLTSYGYAGHFNSPDAPGNDLNFGALHEVFFTLAAGALNVTQFNVYWSGYMAEITDKDAKLVTASFRLTPQDIYQLNFSKYILLDGVLFRLNKITDYNASAPADCQAELIRVLNTTYTFKN